MTKYYLYDVDARILIRHTVETSEQAEGEKIRYRAMTGGHDIRILKLINHDITYDDVRTMIRTFMIFGENSIPKSQTTLFPDEEATVDYTPRELPEYIELLEPLEEIHHGLSRYL
jgi:hypothetical protein